MCSGVASATKASVAQAESDLSRDFGVGHNRDVERRIAEVSDEHMLAIGTLCRRFRVRRLAVFGSAVTGQFKPQSSDFDVAVRFYRDGNLPAADQYFGLKESLEALLGRPVDLVVEDAVRNRFFRAELDETAVEVYAA
jgi:predicted nucleotidyltransferase